MLTVVKRSGAVLQANGVHSFMTSNESFIEITRLSDEKGNGTEATLDFWNKGEFIFRQRFRGKVDPCNGYRRRLPFGKRFDEIRVDTTGYFVGEVIL